jgi:hypothetical protein
MPAGDYDIYADQGATFKMVMRHRDQNNNPINLNETAARLQVRRSKTSPDVLLAISDLGVTGGGPDGFWTPGLSFEGIPGTGGISLNMGETGSLTGGIYISVDATTMTFMPPGNHFYDLKLIQGATVDRILQGRFVVDAEVTR